MPKFRGIVPKTLVMQIGLNQRETEKQNDFVTSIMVNNSNHTAVVSLSTPTQKQTTVKENGRTISNL